MNRKQLNTLAPLPRICQSIGQNIIEKLPYTTTHSLSPFIWLCIKTASLLGLFVLLDQYLIRFCHLPEQSYEKFFLSPELLKRNGIILNTIMLFGSIVLIRYGCLTSKWSEFESKHLRYFIVFLASLIAWSFTTSGYNYYFDQGYYLDRIIIALLVPLIYFRPLFIYPFLMIAYVFMWQLAEPLSDGSIFAHKVQLLHILSLFGGYLLIHALTGTRRTDIFTFLTCCSVAAAYWEPALAKFELNWITFGHLYRMPIAAYQHGWLAFLEPEKIVEFSQLISYFDWPMRIFVLTIEACCLIFLYKRSLSIALLICVMMFHLGVFALYGFLFWTWILLDAALLIILLCDWRTKKLPIYTPGHLFLSVILIGYGGIWFNPSHLGWLDTRLSYTYRYEAVGVSGKIYTLEPHFFAPYGDTFTMGNFTYIVKNHGVLVGPYGITRSRERADRLAEVKNKQQILAFEQEIGPDRYNIKRAQKYFNFIIRYVTNHNARNEQDGFLHSMSPPLQFWSYAQGNIYARQEQIRQVRIKGITTFYQQQKIEVIREIEIALLEIPKPTNILYK